MESRISSRTYFNQGLTGMTTAQNAIAKAMDEISSGTRDIRPSTDSQALSALAELDHKVSLLQQFEKNANAADERLGQAENALQHMTEVMMRAREAAVRFNSAANSDETRDELRLEFATLRDQMLSLLNTQDQRGDYIFAGTQVNTIPYADATSNFLGGASSTDVFLDVGERRVAQVAWPLDGFESVLQTLNDLADSAGPTTVDAANFANIEDAEDRVISFRVEVGQAMTAVELSRSDNEGELYGYLVAQSSLRDTDYTTAITELNKQTLLLQATQGTLAKVQGLSLFNVI
ncbi:MAG: hypothetical protein AB1344_06540 [Pseudomonadota bacterium]